MNVSYFVGRNGWQKVVMQLNWTVLSRLILANPRIAVVEQELEDIKCNAVNECGCNMRRKSSGRYETLTRSSYIARSKRLTEVVITYVGCTRSYQVVGRKSFSVIHILRFEYCCQGNTRTKTVWKDAKEWYYAFIPEQRFSNCLQVVINLNLKIILFDNWQNNVRSLNFF